MESTLVNLGIWAAIVLVIIAIAAAVILPLINSLGNPSTLVKSLGGVGVLIVLFLVSWAISGDEVTAKYISYKVTTASSSQMVGGGLTMMYLLFIIAVIGVVVSEINKALKS